jgi:universal stress protein A
MTNYSHILVGIDLSDESQQVLSRATALATANQASLTLVHVVEPLTFAYGGDIPVDLSEIQEQLYSQATIQLAKLAAPFNISPDNQSILIGQPVAEIQDFAENIGADLIVVGSHGRKGLARLLGSTANGVLHGAKLDVLAIRVK